VYPTRQGAEDQPFDPFEANPTRARPAIAVEAHPVKTPTNMLARFFGGNAEQRVNSAQGFASLGGSTIYINSTRARIEETDAFRANRKLLRQRHAEGIQYFGQHVEDCHMIAFMKQIGLAPEQQPGTFLEMGALDGVRYSNTLALERLGWHGVLIEANPQNCQGLKNSRVSGRSVNFCTAVCGKGVSSAYFNLKQSATGSIVGSSDSKRGTRVACKELGLILRSVGVRHLDFMSLDVEGAEQLVLDTMDWSITIGLLQIEYNQRKMARLTPMLAGRGYRPVGFNHNDLVYASAAMQRKVESSFASLPSSARAYCAQVKLARKRKQRLRSVSQLDMIRDDCPFMALSNYCQYLHPSRRCPRLTNLTRLRVSTRG
jgi:FkbM family methyltransferase